MFFDEEGFPKRYTRRDYMKDLVEDKCPYKFMYEGYSRTCETCEMRTRKKNKDKNFKMLYPLSTTPPPQLMYIFSLALVIIFIIIYTLLLF